MKWTTDEAFQKVKEAGITDSRSFFLRMVRQGRIPAHMHAKKKGYRFLESDVLRFIHAYNNPKEPTPSEQLDRLQRENEALKKQLAMPNDYWMRENQELKRLLQQKEEELSRLKQRLRER